MATKLEGERGGGYGLTGRATKKKLFLRLPFYCVVFFLQAKLGEDRDEALLHFLSGRDHYRLEVEREHCKSARLHFLLHNAYPNPDSHRKPLCGPDHIRRNAAISPA